MSLSYEILLVAVLIAAFGIAAEFITRGTEKLGDLLGQGMSGGVVLGLMSALPETILVVIATISGSYSIAIGAALGGNIVLFTLGMGIIGISYFLKWKQNIVMREDYHVEFAFLSLATVALVLLLIFGSLNVSAGILLISIYLSYVIYRYAKVHHRVKAHMKTIAGRKAIAKGAFYLLLGVLIILAFSATLVQQLVQLSGILGISALWLAIVITPIATDLVELLSTYRLSTRSRAGGSTSIVSYLGGKLENNTVLLGLIGLLAVSPVYLKSSAPAIISVIIINFVVLFAIKRGRFTYRNGIALTLLYFAAIAFTYFAIV